MALPAIYSPKTLDSGLRRNDGRTAVSEVTGEARMTQMGAAGPRVCD